MIDQGRSLALAESYYLVGDRSHAAGLARTISSHIEGERHDRPDPYAGPAEAYLFGGRPNDARRVAKLRLESTPLKLDALDYWTARKELARVCAMLGDTDEALTLLKLVQHGPRPDCGNELRLEPMFVSLRGDAWFEGLAAKSDWK